MMGRILLVLWVACLGLVGCDDAPDEGADPTGDEESEEVEQDEGDVPSCPDGFSADVLSTGHHTGFEVDGEDRSFSLYLPDNGAFADGLPLFVALHGTGETGESFYGRAGLNEFVDQGVIVVAPDGAGHGSIWPVWDAQRLPGDSAANPDLRFVEKLVGCISTSLETDEEKVFAGGHSAGGAMTNALLRQRPEMLAGGIAASGFFELTGAAPGDMPQTPLVTIVTWGGDNDTYQGRTPDGTVIEGVHFSEQAAMASRAYEEAASVEQFYCRGEQRGHVWLSELNEWKLETLLAGPGAEGPQPPTTSGMHACSDVAAERADPVVDAPSCESVEAPECARYCQQFADCWVANTTVGPSIRELTDGLGVTPQSCEPCVSQCEAMVEASPSERAFVECVTADSEALSCQGGLKASLPLFDAINSCCADESESQVCAGICDAIDAQDVSAAFFPVCL